MSVDIIVTASRYASDGYGYNGGGIAEQPEANGTYMNPTLAGGGGGLQWQGIAERLGETVVSKIIEELIEKGLDGMFGDSEEQAINADFSRKADNDSGKRSVTLNNGMSAVKFTDGSYYVDRDRDGKMDLKVTQIDDDVYVDYGNGEGYQRLKATP